jgi:hypothetical protein
MQGRNVRRQFSEAAVFLDNSLSIRHQSVAQSAATSAAKSGANQSGKFYRRTVLQIGRAKTVAFATLSRNYDFYIGEPLHNVLKMHKVV